MNKTDLDRMIGIWDLENNGVQPEESTLAARLEILIYRALAEGKPVTAAHLAHIAGVPLELTEAIFDQGKELGGEWDKDGRLLGNVLTLIPTPHHFRVNGNDLYTWCAMDAVLLPGLLDRPAEVESVDPLTGQSIHLTITPDGIPSYRPAGTVLTIVLSEGDRSGPHSPLCRQMHFFASRDSATTWLEDHPTATIMSVEEVHQFVHEHIHIPLARVLRQLSQFDSVGSGQ